MYAIIVAGGRQYKVQPATVISVNRLHLEPGAVFETDQVLLVENDAKAVQVGAPYVPSAKVKGQVIEHYRDRKVIIFKFKRRKNYRRKRGHRQEMTRVRIDAIEA
ncbi:MAG: 50S ribosomal protein L21 [SAR324 cluster bacterium]